MNVKIHPAKEVLFASTRLELIPATNVLLNANLVSGYELQSGKCVDIDECTDTDICSGPHEKCVNRPGSYRCICKEGYRQKQGICVPAPLKGSIAAIRGRWTPQRTTKLLVEFGKLMAFLVAFGVATYFLSKSWILSTSLAAVAVGVICYQAKAKHFASYLIGALEFFFFRLYKTRCEMPVSKRDKKISLTKVAKTPKDKSAFVGKVKSLVNNYKFIYVINFLNSRNQRLTDLRRELKDSLFLFGKNKLMIIAFGRDKVQETKPGLYKLSKFIKGQCALLFTDMNLDEVRAVFNQFRNADYARPGVEAAQTVILGAGPIPKFSHTLEHPLRKLNLPVKLNRGIVTLESDYKVCSKGDILTPDQCRILKYFEVQISEFQVNISAMWRAADGKVEDVAESDASNVITSLYPKIRVQCETYQGECHYFSQVPIEDKEDDRQEQEEMEVV
nr:hypothetical transcript [Hymenolepis microstoma]